MFYLTLKVKKVQTSAMKDSFQIADCSYLLLQS